MKTNMESIRARHAEQQLQIDSIGPYALNPLDTKAHADRGTLLGVFDKLAAATSELDELPWQSGRPTEGAWWLAVAPNRQRSDYQGPVAVAIGEDGDAWEDGLMGCRIPKDWLAGALWLPRET